MDFLNPATMAKYAAIAAITTHATLRIIPKKGKPSKAPPPKPDDLPQPAPRLKVPSKPTLLVTGGGGLVGTSILRQLTSLGTYNIISIDLFLPPPKSPRHVPQVKYIKANMSDQTAQEMAQLLLHYKVNGIIHTAGVVFMRDDPHTLRNVNHWCSTKLLLAALHICPSCAAFIVTSSASTINPGTKDVNLISPLTRPKDPFLSPSSFSTDYGRTKAAAELDVLDLSSPELGFYTAALRLPGVYGMGDPWMGGPLSRAELTTLPGNADKKVEMVYVENVAHAHITAMATLLKGGAAAKKASGRAYHITNNEPSLTMGEFVSQAITYFPDNPTPNQLPYAVSLMVCCFVELYYWFFQGHVFAPRHPVWNFTRASLGYMMTDQTFSTEGNKLINYEPIHDVSGSLADMLEKLGRKPKK